MVSKYDHNSDMVPTVTATEVCPRNCRHLKVTRALVGHCLRWGRTALDEMPDPDIWGEPQWTRRDGCSGVVR